MSEALVFQTDFGFADGAVAAMYGVALKVDPGLKIYDLTHDIPQYDIWEASYRLIQTVGYWPAGTVFVSVLDPGVGTSRRSVVAKTSGGQLIVTPDNGTLTHVKTMTGIVETLLLSEEANRMPGSGLSYTFHGRDIYAYTGARLAAGRVAFAEVGPAVPPDSVVELPLVPATRDGDSVSGTIDVLDVPSKPLVEHSPGALRRIGCGLRRARRGIHKERHAPSLPNNDGLRPLLRRVNMGEPLVYINSIMNLAVAINQGSFAHAYNIGTGLSRKLSVRKAQIGGC